jgi:hypothetical protein
VPYICIHIRQTPYDRRISAAGAPAMMGALMVALMVTLMAERIAIRSMAYAIRHTIQLLLGGIGIPGGLSSGCETRQPTRGVLR